MAFVYELLYRGHSDGSGAYHVILGEEVVVHGKSTLVRGDPLPPGQADKAGFPLSAIFAEINSAVALELDDLKAAHAQLQTEKIAVEQDRDNERALRVKAEDDLAKERGKKHGQE